MPQNARIGDDTIMKFRVPMIWWEKTHPDHCSFWMTGINKNASHKWKYLAKRRIPHLENLLLPIIHRVGGTNLIFLKMNKHQYLKHFRKMSLMWEITFPLIYGLLYIAWENETYQSLFLMKTILYIAMLLTA